MFDDQITLRHEPLVLRAVAVGINGERIDLFIDQMYSTQTDRLKLLLNFGDVSISFLGRKGSKALRDTKGIG